jgi:hypothetical protein
MFSSSGKPEDYRSPPESEINKSLRFQSSYFEGAIRNKQGIPKV